MQAQKNKMRGSVILITGGTGSFGSTMAKTLLREDVQEIRIFSRDEAKQDALRHSLNDSRARFFLGDTRDFESLSGAVRGVDFIFHAAALKQVPATEFFPLEAVKTNVLGSANVLRAGVNGGCKSIVCLSTDKAVYPINAMGMSKALMEKSAQAIARENLDSDTRIAITRYGNVMYSRGSVIPLFIGQIRKHNEVTVTNPEMTRFLMSLQESVELVKFAFSHSATGDIFVKKAPAAEIGVLAAALVDLFGNSKTKFKTIGTRHGEKLFESLLSYEERMAAEDLGEFFRVPLDARGLDYDLYFSEGRSADDSTESYTSHNTERLTKDEVVELLLQLPDIQIELAKK